MFTSRKSQQQALRIQKLSQQGTESSHWRDGLLKVLGSHGCSEWQHVPALYPVVPWAGSCFNSGEAIVLGG